MSIGVYVCWPWGYLFARLSILPYVSMGKTLYEEKNKRPWTRLNRPLWKATWIRADRFPPRQEPIWDVLLVSQSELSRAVWPPLGKKSCDLILETILIRGFILTELHPLKSQSYCSIGYSRASVGESAVFAKKIIFYCCCPQNAMDCMSLRQESLPK